MWSTVSFKSFFYDTYKFKSTHTKSSIYPQSPTFPELCIFSTCRSFYDLWGQKKFASCFNCLFSVPLCQGFQILSGNLFKFVQNRFLFGFMSNFYDFVVLNCKNVPIFFIALFFDNDIRGVSLNYSPFWFEVPCLLIKTVVV